MFERKCIEYFSIMKENRILKFHNFLYSDFYLKKSNNNSRAGQGADVYGQY